MESDKSSEWFGEIIMNSSKSGFITWQYKSVVSRQNFGFKRFFVDENLNYLYLIGEQPFGNQCLVRL